MSFESFACIKFHEVVDRLAMIGDDLILATGEVVNALAYRAEAYNDRTPLMREIRLEGADL